MILILLNLEHWFQEPFSPYQLVSWLLLVISAYLAVHAALLLRRMGKPSVARADPSLMVFEKTTELVTQSLYRYIRHPMYSSLLFLTWGAFAKYPSWTAAIFAAIATFMLTVTARVEEAENIEYFGSAYKTYMKRSKMFIPFVW